MNYTLTVEVQSSGEILQRREPASIDGVPYPGVSIGALKVKEVFLLQGHRETNEISCEPVDDGHAEILRKNGWKHAD